jgi:phage repressor protein C with HTH and peptisase S24 domain
MSDTPPPSIERLYGPLERGFGLRVDAAVRALGGRAKAAEVMGLSDDQVGKIVAEKSVPNFAAIAALARRSGVSLYWLAFAQEPQQASVASLSTRKVFTADEGTAAEDNASDGVVYLRGYGIGGVADQISSVPFPRRYLEEVVRCHADDVALLEHSGDAMAPTFADHELLMLHLRRREISDGAIVAIRLGGELMVKRVQREPDGSVVLLSDNKSYGPIKMIGDAVDRLDVLGRVIWKAGAV